MSENRSVIPVEAVEAHNCDSAWFMDQYGVYRCARCDALLTEDDEAWDSNRVAIGANPFRREA